MNPKSTSTPYSNQVFYSYFFLDILTPIMKLWLLAANSQLILMSN